MQRNKEKGNGFGWKPTDGNCIANTVKTEGGTDLTQISCLISNQGKRFEKQIAIAYTLMARDYKGFGNQPQNRVIEIE